MCDVLFITPNVSKSFKNDFLGTMQLCTILNNNGLTSKILPFGQIGNVFQFEDFKNQAITKIDAYKPKIISMYTRCDTFHISLKLAELIKAKWNNIYIVFGGPQSDTTAYDVIKNIPFVDFVCCGEGENTIYPFFHSLLCDKPNLNVPGLVYRQNDQVIQNPRPALVEDLDSLPMIDYLGTYLLDYPQDISKTDFIIDVGRGCPFGCAYCSTQAFWGRKYRLKSPQRILEEIEKAHKDLGVSIFHFSHDMFTFNRKMVIEVCRLIKTLSYPIKWHCSARLDCLDFELIDIMVDAGMFRVFVGIETGSKRMQKIVHKNLNLDTVMEKLIYLRDKKVKVVTSFIYGFPDETEDDINQTLSLMAEIMANHCAVVNYHLCAFLPKTELTEKYQSQMTFTDDFSDFTGDFALKDCEDIILKYPVLFPQLMEYKTEMRTKLKHFSMFIKVWRELVPIYQRIAENYAKDNLIEMYYDFVRVNEDILKKFGSTTVSDAVYNIINFDKMHLCLENEPEYDIITDYRRMWIAEHRNALPNEENTEIYCFDPRERKRIVPIQDYKRCIAIVTYKENTINIKTARISDLA